MVVVFQFLNGVVDLSHQERVLLFVKIQFVHKISPLNCATNYTVKYYPTNDSSKVTEKKDLYLSATISGLTIGTEYTFEVYTQSDYESNPYRYDVPIIFSEKETITATPKIENNQLVIDTTNCGTVDHAVQVIHPDIPLKKGVKYQFSFDAMASENRTIIAAITAPNAGWARYFPDTRVEVGPTKKSFNFEFTMKEESDPKGRIEFNLGNQDSIAQVKISNVKFKALTPLTDVVEVKAMLPDGNYMYNAEFQEGENRLSNWQIVKNDKSYNINTLFWNNTNITGLCFCRLS